MKNLTILETKELVSNYEGGNTFSHKCIVNSEIVSNSGLVIPTSKIVYWNMTMLIPIGETFNLELIKHSIEDKSSSDGKTFSKLTLKF